MSQRDQQRRRTKYLAVSAILTALGVIILSLGSLIEVLDLSTAVLASILCVYAMIEMGGAYPWMIWLATAILSALLLPLKTPAFFYALFFGYYPILKAYLERLPGPVEWILKLVSLHASLVLIWLLFKIFIPSEPETETHGMLYLLYGMILCGFFLYDYVLTKLITLYLRRLRDRFRIR